MLALHVLPVVYRNLGRVIAAFAVIQASTVVAKLGVVIYVGMRASVECPAWHVLSV